MSSQSDNFEQIRKLVALKRYEQPPPGYFENLSARIISRIESAETDRPTLWERLGFAFGSKPAFICAMGVVVCGLFCIGILSTLQGTTVNALNAPSRLAFDPQSSLPLISAPEQARSSIEPVVSQVSAFSPNPAGVEKVAYAPGR